MKKLLAVLLAAMMVLSIAAVSMAAATVEGDWRWEWTKEDGQHEKVGSDYLKNEDLKFATNDLRLNFKGKVSDTVDAYMQYTFGTKTELKEYYVTLKQSWGKVQAGVWDHKLIPSRVIIKPHGINCVNSKTINWLFDIPVGDAMTVGLWLVPDLKDDLMDYDVKFAYKGDGFGAEVHYGVDKSVDSAAYTAFDVYYNVAENIKLFLMGINVSDEYGMANIKTPWCDNLAPVIGAVFSNIGGSKLTASLEYGLENAWDQRDGEEFAPMAVQLKYAFNNKVNLEIEYYNYNAITHEDGLKYDMANENKIVIRPRVKF